MNRAILVLSIGYYAIRITSTFFSWTRVGEMAISFTHYRFFLDSLMVIMIWWMLARYVAKKKKYQWILVLEIGSIIFFLLTSYYHIDQVYQGKRRSYQHSSIATSQPIARVLYANILKSNTHYEELRLLIEKNNPSIIFFAERQRHHWQSLETVLASYPHRMQYSYGSVVFSRFPFEEKESKKTTDWRTYWHIAVSFSSWSLYDILFAHTTSPVSPQNYSSRNQQLIILGEAMKEQSLPTIVLGDLNVTPYSPWYQATIAIQNGYENQVFHQQFPSTRWFANNDWFPQTHIDHILTTKDILLWPLTIIPLDWSDHHAIMVDIYSWSTNDDET